MAKICVIDENHEKPAAPFLQEAFQELGHETTTAFASTPSRSQLKQDLEASGADLFVAIQNVGFSAGDVLTMPPFVKVKKAVLCYDDPETTYMIFGKTHPWITDPASHHVHFFIWDGYWRQRMSNVTNWKSLPTHLAAETKNFSPEKKDVLPGIKHCLVFLGNLPTIKLCESLESQLPGAHQEASKSTYQKICKGKYALNPFEALEEAIRELPLSQQQEIHQQTETYLSSAPDLSRPLAPHIQLRHLAWQYGKRETRLRALRAAARVAPIAILSNLKNDRIAGKDELTQEFRGITNGKLLFVDTSNAGYYHLTNLYSAGFLQFQSTDPQSVEGGIPYRVFQSAACGVPLLSDSKKELAECFKPDEEILLYDSDKDLPDVLARIVANPERLKAIGQAAYQRFLKEHTWTHRMRGLLESLEISSHGGASSARRGEVSRERTSPI